MFQAKYAMFARDADDAPSLDFPNREMEAAFHAGLFFNCFNRQLDDGNRERQLIKRMADAFETGDCASALNAFDRILDGVTYTELAAESNFRIALHVICFKVRSFLRVVAESATRRIRADIAVETRDAFYAFELKMNQSVAAALQQIEDRGYLDRYAGAGKRVAGIGLNFIQPRPDAEETKLWEAKRREL